MTYKFKGKQTPATHTRRTPTRRHSLHTAQQHKTEWVKEREREKIGIDIRLHLLALLHWLIYQHFLFFFSPFFSPFVIAVLVSSWSSRIHLRLKRRMNFQWAHGILLLFIKPKKKKIKQFIIFIERTDRDKHTGKIFVNEMGKKRNTHVAHRIARTYIRSSYFALFFPTIQTHCVRVYVYCRLIPHSSRDNTFHFVCFNAKKIKLNEK